MVFTPGRIGALAEFFRQELDPGAAGDGEDGLITVDVPAQRLQVFRVALAL